MKQGNDGSNANTAHQDEQHGLDHQIPRRLLEPGDDLSHSRVTLRKSLENQVPVFRAEDQRQSQTERQQ
jgi:hypothetical protein